MQLGIKRLGFAKGRRGESRPAIPIMPVERAKQKVGEMSMDQREQQKQRRKHLLWVHERIDMARRKREALEGMDLTEKDCVKQEWCCTDGVRE